MYEKKFVGVNNRFSRLASWASFVLGLLVVAGCGPGNGLGYVTGVVTLDDKPLPEASVEFVPENGVGLTSYGRTDADGAYYMMATRTENGAAVGSNIVRISTYEVIDMKNSRPEKVPVKYNVRSELRADVKSGSNTFNFTLSSEGGRILERKNDPSNQ